VETTGHIMVDVLYFISNMKKNPISFIWESPHILLSKAGFLWINMTEIVIYTQSLAKLSVLNLSVSPFLCVDFKSVTDREKGRPKRPEQGLILHFKEQLINEVAFQSMNACRIKTQVLAVIILNISVSWDETPYV
jgi:hypothetical protein